MRPPSSQTAVRDTSSAIRIGAAFVGNEIVPIPEAPSSLAACVLHDAAPFRFRKSILL